MLGTLFKYLGIYQRLDTSVKAKKVNPIIGMIIGILPFTWIMYSFTYRIFKTLAVQQEIAYIFYLFSLSFFSLMFLAGFIGWGMYAFSRIPEVEYLLTMPINKKVLAIYQILSTTFSQMLQLALFFGTGLAYAFATKTFNLFFLGKLILNIFYLLAIGSLISILLGGLSSKTLVKRVNAVVLIISMFSVFGLMYLLDYDFSMISGQEKFLKLLIFSQSEYNFLSWVVRDEAIYNYISLGLTILLLLIFFEISKKIGYEPSISKRKRQDVKSELSRGAKSSILSAVYFKDLKVLTSSEQFVILLLYPLGFGIFMGFLSPNVMTTIVPFTAITTFYVAFEAGMLMKNEKNYLRYVAILPITFKQLLFPKVLIPLVINILMTLGLAIVLIYKGTELLIVSLLILIVTFLFGVAGILGSYFTLVDEKSISKKQPFGFLSTIWVELVTIGSSMGILTPLNLIYNKQLSTGNWRYTVSLLVLFGTIVADILLSWLFLRKLKKVYEFSIEKA